MENKRMARCGWCGRPKLTEQPCKNCGSLGNAPRRRPMRLVHHDHPEYVEGCFRCELSRDETQEEGHANG